MSWTPTDAVPRYVSKTPSPSQSAQKATYSCEPALHRSPPYPAGRFTWMIAPKVSVGVLRPTHVSSSKAVFPPPSASVLIAADRLMPSLPVSVRSAWPAAAAAVEEMLGSSLIIG
jgi:hypothetical protein